MLKDALGEYRGTIGELSRIIGEQPENAEAYYSRANAKSCAGDYVGAVKDFTMALKIGLRFREMITAYGNRGIARMETGDNDGAIADFSAIITRKPNNRLLLRSAYVNRALLKERQGELQGAAWDRKMAELCTHGKKQQ